MPYLEIKTRSRIDIGLAQKIVAKGAVIAIITTGVISSSAKSLFNENRIAWAENIPEQEFMNFTMEEIE